MHAKRTHTLYNHQRTKTNPLGYRLATAGAIETGRLTRPDGGVLRWVTCGSRRGARREAFSRSSSFVSGLVLEVVGLGGGSVIQSFSQSGRRRAYSCACCMLHDDGHCTTVGRPLHERYATCYAVLSFFFNSSLFCSRT
ncbi:unnamed protein product [Periconia digitata]|uniref:Uncharacterized protein n=1 Tax=Periconia digitata TaxID=1303443 RepID=A0A9W4U0L5_9PLEO|nr:unnamed protein product [Periconia digitata]